MTSAARKVPSAHQLSRKLRRCQMIQVYTVCAVAVGSIDARLHFKSKCCWRETGFFLNDEPPTEQGSGCFLFSVRCSAAIPHADEMPRGGYRRQQATPRPRYHLLLRNLGNKRGERDRDKHSALSRIGDKQKNEKTQKNGFASRKEACLKHPLFTRVCLVGRALATHNTSPRRSSHPATPTAGVLLKPGERQPTGEIFDPLSRPLSRSLGERL